MECDYYAPRAVR